MISIFHHYFQQLFPYRINGVSHWVILLITLVIFRNLTYIFRMINYPNTDRSLILLTNQYLMRQYTNIIVSNHLLCGSKACSHDGDAGKQINPLDLTNIHTQIWKPVCCIIFQSKLICYYLLLLKQETSILIQYHHLEGF